MLVTIIGGIAVAVLTSIGAKLSTKFTSMLVNFADRLSSLLVIRIPIWVVLLCILLFVLFKKIFINSNIKSCSDKMFINEVSMTNITYTSTNKVDTIEFDYSDNDGEFTIGEDEYLFNTQWSKASDTSIYACSDGANIEKIALIKNKNIKEFENGSLDISKLNYSSRCRTAHIGDIIVWINKQGNLACTKVLEIKDDTRGSENDYLKFEYEIHSKSGAS